MLINHPGHTRELWDPVTLKQLAKRTTLVTEDLFLHHDIDALAVCGHSGLVLGGLVSAELQVPLIAVRKPSEMPVAGGATAARTNFRLPDHNDLHFRYLILDDTICTGSTVLNIYDNLNKECGARYGFAPTLVGVLLHYMGCEGSIKLFCDGASRLPEVRTWGVHYQYQRLTKKTNQ